MAYAVPAGRDAASRPGGREAGEAVWSRLFLRSSLRDAYASTRRVSILVRLVSSLGINAGKVPQFHARATVQSLRSTSARRVLPTVAASTGGARLPQALRT